MAISSTLTDRERDKFKEGSSGETLVQVTDEASLAIITDVRDSVKNVVDDGNSTTTPLGANETFTGVAIDVSKYGSVTTAAYTDQSSASGGAQFQFSPDGTNWDEVKAFTLTASSPAFKYGFSNIHYKYFRVVYTNGSTPQSYFRMQTILHSEFSVGHQTTLNGPLDNEDIVNIGRSVIVGESSAGGGSFVNVKIEPSGKILTYDENLETSLLDELQKKELVSGVDYDSIAFTYPTSTQEVVTFSLSATPVKTITINYTDSTKANISTVVYT